MYSWRIRVTCQDSICTAGALVLRVRSQYVQLAHSGYMSEVNMYSWRTRFTCQKSICTASALGLRVRSQYVQLAHSSYIPIEN